MVEREGTAKESTRGNSISKNGTQSNCGDGGSSADDGATRRTAAGQLTATCPSICRSGQSAWCFYVLLLLLLPVAFASAVSTFSLCVCVDCQQLQTLAVLSFARQAVVVPLMPLLLLVLLLLPWCALKHGTTLPTLWQSH